MDTRKLGTQGLEVSAEGLGCMGMTWAYGPSDGHDAMVGLLLNAISLFWQGHLTVDTPYTNLLGAFVLMGLGMGLVMSPMSTAAMNAVDPTKAGVASGVLSMSRMVGGTFGVAAMGALITGLGRSKIDETLPQLPESARHGLAEGLGKEIPGSRESGIFRYSTLLFAGRTDRAAAGISGFGIGTKHIAHGGRHVVRV